MSEAMRDEQRLERAQPQVDQSRATLDRRHPHQ
jgi:hypothetical protein